MNLYIKIVLAIVALGNNMYVYSQCAPVYPPSFDCQLAPLSCLNNICYSLTDEWEDDRHFAWCGDNTLIDNPQYYLFQATDTAVEVSLYLNYCSVVVTNEMIQAAIINIDDDLSNCINWDVSDVLVCEAFLYHPTTLYTGGLDSGAHYLFMVDGFAGSICSYRITTSSNIYSPPLSSELDQALTGGLPTSCPGDTAWNAWTGPLVYNAQGYLWSGFPWGDGIETSIEPILNSNTIGFNGIPIDASVGIYNICVSPFSGCDTGEVVCFQLEILNNIDLGQIDTSFCGNEFEYKGVTYTESGTYELTYENGSPDGCDSIALLNLELVYIEAMPYFECDLPQIHIHANPSNIMPSDATVYYLWTDIDGNFVAQPDEFWTVDSAGIYFLQILIQTDELSCVYPSEESYWSIEVTVSEYEECTFCNIVSVTATPSDCDSSGMFNVVLDVEFAIDGEDYINVYGNDEGYGFFINDSFPLELGPFDGSVESNWYFYVELILLPDCRGYGETGMFICEPSGLYSPSNVKEINVFYDEGHPYFTLPENDLNFTLWDSNGRMLASDKLTGQESIIYLNTYTNHIGLVIIRLEGNESNYVAKAVISR